jgi:hypothetical protein
MPRKPTSQFGGSPVPVRLRRLAVRYLRPFLVRWFDVAIEEKPLGDALKQISLTLRVMGIQPEDPIVERIGSEFRMLFCGPVPEGKKKPSESLLDPLESISSMLRGHTAQPRDSAVRAILRQFVAFCARPILMRLRRFFSQT